MSELYLLEEELLTEVANLESAKKRTENRKSILNSQLTREQDLLDSINEETESKEKELWEIQSQISDRRLDEITDGWKVNADRYGDFSGVTNENR